MTESLAIILAAGIGERMNSKTHKVLHSVQGAPIIDYVLRAVRGASVSRVVVVVGNRAEQVEEYLGDDVEYALQDPDKGWGTAKAVQSALEYVGDGPIFVVLGDSPLIRAETLSAMCAAVEDGAIAAIMTAVVDDPTGYGRVIRDARGDVCAIVEHKEATEEQRKVCEINSAALCIDGRALREALPKIRNDNTKAEYYLTDLVGILYGEGGKVVAVRAEETDGVGVNNRMQLAEASALMRARINHYHMSNGVSLIDPDRIDIGPDVVISEDTVIYPGCSLMGKTLIGGDCVLLPNCRLEDVTLGTGVKVESSVLIECQVGKDTTIGPFAYLRPGTIVGEHVRIGDFVEIKNSNIGDETRISHLTYVGDGDLGRDINLGCGVVFVNYDGKNKRRSRVGDHAFIGCNVNLVAPVDVGERAYVAAGTTVTENIPAYALAIGRPKSHIKEGWVKTRMSEGKL